MDILGKSARVGKGQPKEAKFISKVPLQVERVTDIGSWLDKNRHILSYPEATLGDEPGSFHRSWKDSSLRVCMVAWNGYMQLLGSLTLPMLVRMVGEADESILCERAFFPNDRRELALYEKYKLPIFSLESKKSIRDFDVIGFSVAVTGVDINVVKMLAMSGIPVFSKDRGEDFPVVIRGGISSGNVSPVGAFYDICFLGEAEAGMVKILQCIKDMKRKGETKKEILLHLANHYDGVYVPAFYEEEFDPETKRYLRTKVLEDVPAVVKRAYVKNLDSAYIYRHPIIHYGGCLSSRTKILVDGKAKMIGKVVNRNIRGKVKSVDLDSGVVEEKRIVKYFFNGKSEDWWNLKWRNGGGYFTGDHRILVGGKFKRVMELRRTDVLDCVDWVLGDTEKQLLLGSLVGDSGVYPGRKRESHARVVLYCGPEEEDYLRWKESYFVGLLTKRHFQVDGVIEVGTKENRCFDEFLHMKREGLKKSGWFELMGPLAWAVWYQDDGSYERADYKTSLGERGKNRSFIRIACNKLGVEGAGEALESLKRKTGILGKVLVTERKNRLNPDIRICFTCDESEKLLKWMSSFVFMTRKGGKEFKAPKITKKLGLWKNAVGIECLSEKKDGHSNGRYSIEVDGNHNYLLPGGVVSSNSMGLGEMLVNRSCDNSCCFCSESWLTKPYREVSSEVVVEAMKQNMEESGADSILPSAFCLSSHSERSRIVKRLYTEVSDDVKLISQRTDDFAKDPEFVTLSRVAGNYNVSLGIEGLSQRLRNLVNKNVTEQDILSAHENAMRAGYRKIKNFMIANLPTETEEDRQEFMSLLEKIAAIKKKLNSTCEIRCNWTNLNIVDHSPFQWFCPDLEGRNLSVVLKRAKELGIGVGFGASKTSDSDFFSQMLFLGDSRLCSIIADIALEFGSVYFRGIKKGTLDFFLSKLTEKGLSRDDYIRARDKDEPFPWDMFDFGISREFLWKRHLECKEGKNQPRCKAKCSDCGACDIVDKKIMGKVRAPKDLKMSMEEVNSLVPIRQKGTVQRYLLKIVQDEKHKFLPKVVKKMILRRALYLSGLPTTKSLSFASDLMSLDNWCYGADYVDIPLHTHSFDVASHLEKMNSNLAGMKVLGVKRYSPAVGGIQSNCSSILYALQVQRDLTGLQDLVQSFLEAEPVSDDLDKIEGKLRNAYVRDHVNVVRVKVSGNRGEIIQKMVDIRPMILAAHAFPSGLVYVLIKGNLINAHHFYKALTRRNWMDVRLLDQYRVDISMEGNLGWYGPKCSSCGKPVLINLFGESIKDVCISCLFSKLNLSD